MEKAGVYTSVYKPHSAISATASKVASLGIPTDVILSRAGWKSDICFVCTTLNLLRLRVGQIFSQLCSN